MFDILDPIERAKRYPFAPPADDYLFDHGRVRPFDGGDVTRGRLAVIAAGSNAAPSRLAAKFAGCRGEDGRVPVTTAEIEGFTVVHSAHFASYGSIPATLHPASGERSRVRLTWLTEGQLARMHQTEAIGVNYGFYRLRAVTLTRPSGETIGDSYAYVSLPGALHIDERPAKVADWSQLAILARVCALIAPDVELDDLLRQVIADADRRAVWKAALRRHGRPANSEALERLI